MFVKIFIQKLGHLDDAKFFKCGVRGAFLGTDSCKSFGGSDGPVNSCLRTQQAVGGRHPKPQRKHQSPDWECGRVGCPGAARGASSPSIRPAGLWTRGRLRRGEVKFTGSPPAHRFRGSRGLAEPGAGRTVTLFHSATPFCRLLTKQSENTAPSLLLSEVRDVVGCGFFFFPSLPSPPPPFSEPSSPAAAYNAGS